MHSTNGGFVARGPSSWPANSRQWREACSGRTETRACPPWHRPVPRRDSSLRAPAIGCRPSAQQFALGLLSGAQEGELLLIDVPLDNAPHQLAQPAGGNGIKLDGRIAPEFFCPRVCWLGRSSRKIPFFNLLARYGRSLEMDLRIGGIAAKLGLDVAACIDAGRVQVAE